MYINSETSFHLNTKIFKCVVGGPYFVPDLISSPCLFMMKSHELFVDCFTQTIGRVKYSWLTDFPQESMAIGTLLIEFFLTNLQNSRYNI